MSDDNGRIDAWLRMHEEQIRFVRHHEDMRSRTTNFILTLSAVFIALIGADQIARYEWLIGLSIGVLNSWGLLASRKHYERSRYHARLAKGIRKEISRATEVGGFSIEKARDDARNEQAKEFSFSWGLRVHVVWEILHVILVAAGLFLAVRYLCQACGGS